MRRLTTQRRQQRSITQRRQRRQTKTRRGGKILGKGTFGAVYETTDSGNGLTCGDDLSIKEEPGIVSKILRIPKKIDEEMILNILIQLKGLNREEVEKYFLLPIKSCEINSRSCTDGPTPGTKQYCETAEKCDTCDETGQKTGRDRMKMVMGQDYDTLKNESNPYFASDPVNFVVLPKANYDLPKFIKTYVSDFDLEKMKMVYKKLVELENGLKLIHANNIYHLDIKPANIMYLENSDAFKFIDFEMMTYLDDTKFVGTKPRYLVHVYYPTFWALQSGPKKFAYVFFFGVKFKDYLYKILKNIHVFVLRNDKLRIKYLIFLWQIFCGRISLNALFINKTVIFSTPTIFDKLMSTEQQPSEITSMFDNLIKYKTQEQMSSLYEYTDYYTFGLTFLIFAERILLRRRDLGPLVEQIIDKAFEYINMIDYNEDELNNLIISLEQKNSDEIKLALDTFEKTLKFTQKFNWISQQP